MKEFVVITGGTSGLGFELAKKLILNFNLALIYKENTERALESVKVLESINSSAKVAIFKVDLSFQEHAEKVYQDIKFEFQESPVFLLNCAGKSYVSFFVKDLIEDFKTSFDQNFYSSVFLTHFCLKDMYKKKFGKIIFISSSSVDKSAANGVSSYSSAKAALENLTLKIGKEVDRKGVTVNCIRPPLFLSPMTSRLVQNFTKQKESAIPIDRVVDEVLYFLTGSGSNENANIKIVKNE